MTPINFENSKKLSDLEVNFPTYLYYDLHGTIGNNPPLWEGDYFPAYLACELDKILPNEIDDGTGNYFIYRSGMLFGYRDVTGKWLCQFQGTKKLADKLCDVLVWLIQNKYMEVLKGIPKLKKQYF